MQRYIQGVIELKQAHGFRAGDVVKVDVDVNPMVPPVHPLSGAEEHGRGEVQHASQRGSGNLG